MFEPREIHREMTERAAGAWSMSTRAEFGDYSVTFYAASEPCCAVNTCVVFNEVTGEYQDFEWLSDLSAGTQTAKVWRGGVPF